MNKFLFSFSILSLLLASQIVQSITIYHVPTITVYRLKNQLLVEAAAKGKEKLALSLLTLPGIKTSTRDKLGKTALHYAAEQGLTDLAKALIAQGANVKLADSQGKKPSDLALSAGHADLAKLLDE